MGVRSEWPFQKIRAIHRVSISSFYRSVRFFENWNMMKNIAIINRITNRITIIDMLLTPKAFRPTVPTPSNPRTGSATLRTALLNRRQVSPTRTEVGDKVRLHAQQRIDMAQPREVTHRCSASLGPCERALRGNARIRTADHH